MAVGIISADADPVAQLLAEGVVADGGRVGQIVGLGPIPDMFDRLIVSSQWQFLAHAEAILSKNVPCLLVVRACADADGADEWDLALGLLANVLSGVESVKLHALTAERARTLSDRLGRTVTPLVPPRLRAAAARRLGWIDLDNRRLLIGPTGTDPMAETPDTGQTTLPLDLMNWARLCRHVDIAPAVGLPDDMTDLVAFSGAAAWEGGDGARSAPVCVIVIPNGVGLGHLTRMLAVADALIRQGAERVVFWCFSRAAQLIRQAGYPVEARQTAAHIEVDPDIWRRHETARFARFLKDVGANTVIFDGSAPHRFLSEALRVPGNGQIDLLWVRRGLWNARADTSVLEATPLFDCIIEPGDLARAADTGIVKSYRPADQGWAHVLTAPPVTLLNRDDMLSRRAARRALGLGRGRIFAVSLGGDELASQDVLTRLLMAEADAAGVRLIFLRSPLAGSPPFHDRATAVRYCYPVSRYLNAFDGVISAAGYNSFHELMTLYDGPVLFAPVRHLRLDDQPARAAFAAVNGWAAILAPEASSTHRATIGAFFLSVKGRKPRAPRPNPRDGAGDIARLILQNATGERL